jgi:hypothetical protein
MQVETALRLPALAMQLSKVVKTLVLRATNVPGLEQQRSGQWRLRAEDLAGEHLSDVDAHSQQNQAARPLVMQP